jgi:hypothetical protein
MRANSERHSDHDDDYNSDDSVKLTSLGEIVVLFGGTTAAALVDLFYGPKEMCKVIRCDSFSELPGIHLGTS